MSAKIPNLLCQPKKKKRDGPRQACLRFGMLHACPHANGGRRGRGSHHHLAKDLGILSISPEFWRLARSSIRKRYAHHYIHQRYALQLIDDWRYMWHHRILSALVLSLVVAFIFFWSFFLYSLVYRIWCYRSLLVYWCTDGGSCFLMWGGATKLLVGLYLRPPRCSPRHLLQHLLMKPSSNSGPQQQRHNKCFLCLFHLRNRQRRPRRPHRRRIMSHIRRKSFTRKLSKPSRYVIWWWFDTGVSAYSPAQTFFRALKLCFIVLSGS